MQNKIIKLLLISAILLLTLEYVYAQNEPQFCIGALACSSINPGDYNIMCDRDLNSFCPEDYDTLEWNTCPDLNYGKCAPCDPDCGSCGSSDLIFHVYREPSITPTYSDRLFSGTCSPSGAGCDENFIDSLLTYEIIA